MCLLTVPMYFVVFVSHKHQVVDLCPIMVLNADDRMKISVWCFAVTKQSNWKHCTTAICCKLFVIFCQTQGDHSPYNVTLHTM